METKTLDEIITLAIKKEEESFDLYTRLHGMVEDKMVKDTLMFLAGQETKHKEFLVDYRNGKYPKDFLRMDKVIDYKIAQYVDTPEIKKNMDSVDVYLVAAHRELNSYNLYMNLAGEHPDGEIKEILTRMANEELKHKEKVEYLYSNSAFPQTQGG